MSVGVLTHSDNCCSIYCVFDVSKISRSLVIGTSVGQIYSSPYDSPSIHQGREWLYQQAVGGGREMIISAVWGLAGNAP